MLYPNQTGSVHKEIIRLLSLYHRLKFRQMLLLFPQLSETAFHSILKQLQKQGRISLQESSVVHRRKQNVLMGWRLLLMCFWTSYRKSPTMLQASFLLRLPSLPVKNVMRSSGCRKAKNFWFPMLLSLQLRPPDNYQRLIVLSSETQLELAGRLPDVTAYCLPRNGKIHYYKKGLTYGPNHPEYPA